MKLSREERDYLRREIVKKKAIDSNKAGRVARGELAGIPMSFACCLGCREEYIYHPRLQRFHRCRT